MKTNSVNRMLLPLASLTLLLMSTMLIHAASTNWIYTDALVNGWQDWSYNSTRDFDNPDPVYADSTSLKVAVTDDWGALSLNHAAIAVADYDALTFAIRAISTSPDLQLVCRNGDTRFTDLFLSDYTSGPVSTTDWQLVSIPLADFEITNSTITRFDWQGRQTAARPEFLLDQVGLIPYAILSLNAAHAGSLRTIDLTFSDLLDTTSVASAEYSLQNSEDINYTSSISGTFEEYQPDNHRVTIAFPYDLTTNGTYVLIANNITNQTGDAAIHSVTTQITLVRSTVNIVCMTNEHRISPYIYGVNLAPDINYLRGAGFTVNRRSGNDNSCYNWELETSNKAEDGWYSNFNWDPVHPTNSLELTALMNAQAGAATLWTMPMQEWVAKDNHSYSFSVAKYGQQELENGDLGNGYETNGTDRITNNTPTDAYVPAKAYPETGDATDTVYMNQWLEHLKKQFGPLTTALFPFVSLDNEIDIWYDVHHDTWHSEMTYEVMKEKFITYSAMIHSNLPGLKVHGPVSTSWWFYWNSDAGAADKTAHGNIDFLEWFLQEMKAYEDANGQRVLDILDIHYYPAKPLIFNATTDTNTRAIRIAEVESFWNTNYIDAWDGISNNPWAAPGQLNNDKPYIIPRFKALIASNYPGTKLAISEWQMGADNDISAGISVADALGVFGREDLYMACYWRWGNDMPTNSAAYNAFKLFGNYDNQGSRFASISVPALASGTDSVSTYASRSEDGTRLTVMCINKSDSTDCISELNFSSFSPNTNFTVARISSTATDTIQLQHLSGGAAATTVILPAYSATLLEFTAPAIDDDSDGMPTPWEQFYTNATDAGVTPLDPYFDDSAFDYDHDSASNLDEYKALTNPTASNDVFKLAYSRSDFSGIFSCTGAAGLSFECVTSTNLNVLSSNWTSLGSQSGTDLMLLWSNELDTTRTYYRVKAQ